MTCKERAEMEVVDISSSLRLRQGEVEKEDGFDSCVEWNPESPIFTKTKKMKNQKLTMKQAIQRDIQLQRYIPSPTSTSTIVLVRLPRLAVDSAFCRMHMLDRGMQKMHFTSGRTIDRSHIP